MVHLPAHPFYFHSMENVPEKLLNLISDSLYWAFLISPPILSMLNAANILSNIAVQKPSHNETTFFTRTFLLGKISKKRTKKLSNVFIVDLLLNWAGVWGSILKKHHTWTWTLNKIHDITSRRIKTWISLQIFLNLKRFCPSQLWFLFWHFSETGISANSIETLKFLAV